MPPRLPAAISQSHWNVAAAAEHKAVILLNSRVFSWVSRCSRKWNQLSCHGNGIWFRLVFRLASDVTFTSRNRRVYGITDKTRCSTGYEIFITRNAATLLSVVERDAACRVFPFPRCRLKFQRRLFSLDCISYNSLIDCIRLDLTIFWSYDSFLFYANFASYIHAVWMLVK